MQATYILPIRRTQPDENLNELTDYICWLATQLEVIVVDGSPPETFTLHHACWASSVTHITPATDITVQNGKVRGVLSGLRLASHERVIIADDDVRYDHCSLTSMLADLEHAQVVRPQNYFDQLPWHALWDTGRTLLNRMTGGDWPGTLGVHLSILKATNGYDGNVLFENLELVRTIRAAGGKEHLALDLYVRRLPPDGKHFWSQRVRQAYDEFARPLRMAVFLAILPSILLLITQKRWQTLLTTLFSTIALAEMGRRRRGGSHYFPFTASLLSPIWLIERAICVWLALGLRLFSGGVPYYGTTLTRAANPEKVLRQRHAQKHDRATAPQTVTGGITTNTATVLQRHKP